MTSFLGMGVGEMYFAPLMKSLRASQWIPAMILKVRKGCVRRVLRRALSVSSSRFPSHVAVRILLCSPVVSNWWMANWRRSSGSWSEKRYSQSMWMKGETWKIFSADCLIDFSEVSPFLFRGRR